MKKVFFLATFFLFSIIAFSQDFPIKFKGETEHPIYLGQQLDTNPTFLDNPYTIEITENMIQIKLANGKVLKSYDVEIVQKRTDLDGINEIVIITFKTEIRGFVGYILYNGVTEMGRYAGILTIPTFSQDGMITSVTIFAGEMD